MIFVALGTCEPFPRLLKKLDELAGKMEEEFIVQSGKTHIPVKNCRVFDYLPSLQESFSQARLVIAHAGLGVQIELMRMQKPFIVVPRQKRFKEHFDDHQLETCEILGRQYGIKYIENMEDLTVDLLEHYDYVAPYSDRNLNIFRERISQVLSKERK